MEVNIEKNISIGWKTQKKILSDCGIIIILEY